MSDLKIKRAPQTESDQRAWETVYDDINDIIASVNQKSSAESRNGSAGNDGDIRLFKDVDATKYFIEGKFGDGWAKRELLFSDTDDSGQDESINYSSTENYIKPDGSVNFTAKVIGVSPAGGNTNHLATKGYVDSSVNFTAMGSGNSYAAGLVLAGASSHNDTYLRKDGTWGTPIDTNTTSYSLTDAGGSSGAAKPLVFTNTGAAGSIRRIRAGDNVSLTLSEGVSHSEWVIAASLSGSTIEFRQTNPLGGSDLEYDTAKVKLIETSDGSSQGVTWGYSTSNNVLSITPTLVGYQASGTYNTIIGTDSDIDTSGATIIDSLTMTDGVITAHGTRSLTASDLGLGSGTDSDINTSGAAVLDTLVCNNGIVTSHSTRNLTTGDIGASPAAGSSSITTVGTIGTGTWQGSSISVSYTDADNYNYWAVNADSGGTTNVTAGSTMKIAGGTGIETSRSGAIVTASITSNSIGNAQLEYDTGQALTTSSSPTFNTVTCSKIRLTSTTDVSATSTGHGLQIGDSGNLNFAIDNNELIARDDDAISTLHLSPDGGPTSGSLDNISVRINHNVSGGHINFYDNGDIDCLNLKARADVWAYTSSDPSLKDNKKLINNSLDIISKIGGYTFDWNEKAADHLQGHDYGVMADEIEAVMPELVTTRDNGIKAVRYEGIIPLLIEAIKQLKSEVNNGVCCCK